MGRITKHEPSENSMFPYKLKDDELSTKLDGIHKLGQHEDIEDELGIKLTTLHKALKNCIYVKDNNEIKKAYPILSYMLNEGFVFDVLCSRIVKLSDYDKTWALTKEELETKDIKEDASKLCNEKGCYYCENNSPDACPLFKHLNEIRYSIKR